MIDHIVRRGVQHASGMDMVKRAMNDAEIKLPNIAIGVIVAGFFVIVVFLSLVEYMLKDVVATLSMVETPTAAITISTPDEPANKDEKEGLLESSPTTTLVHQKPLTSSIRATIKHLVSQGGHFARYRGYRYHICWAFAFNFVGNGLDAVIPSFVPCRVVILSGLAGALTANVHAAWTHKVISMPSNMSLWQRIPSRSHWKSLALPVAVYAAMPYVSLYVAMGTFQLLGLNRIGSQDVREFDGADWAGYIARVVALVVVVFGSLLLCIPATVTMIRVEASILPEDDDTIVPFDRSFDGKVVPKVLGGTGSIGFVDAWKSFNWEARRRLLKLYVKIFSLMMTLTFLMVHVWVLVGFLAMGPQRSKEIAKPVLSRAISKYTS